MFLLEPAIIGLGSGFSLPGLLLTLAALGAFLTRHPLKLAVDDHLKGKRFSRTTWAESFALLYGFFTSLMVVSCALTARHPFVLPLIIAAPAAILQLYLDATKRGRELLAELSGAVAMSALVAANMLLAGFGTVPAFALWMLVICRVVTSILYVRTRLRLARGQPIAKWPVWISHAGAMLLMAPLAYVTAVPWTILPVTVLWFVRAYLGLSATKIPVRAQVVGIQEVIVGLVSSFVVVAGYWLR